MLPDGANRWRRRDGFLVTCGHEFRSFTDPQLPDAARMGERVSSFIVNAPHCGTKFKSDYFVQSLERVQYSRSVQLDDS